MKLHAHQTQLSMTIQERTVLTWAILAYEGILNDRLAHVAAVRTRDHLRQESINQARAILTAELDIMERFYTAIEVLKPERTTS